MTDRQDQVTVYVDTSFLLAATAPDEPQHAAAVRWLSRHPGSLLTSVLAEVEAGRALARRAAGPSLQAAAERRLAAGELVDVTAEIRAEAVRVVPTSVRSLEALHVATALVAGLQEFASVDVRQQVAAEEAGLPLATP
jgi:predicted nucleic acid-binding protein